MNRSTARSGGVKPYHFAAWVLILFVVGLSVLPGGAQAQFDTSLTGARRATSAGEARKALLYFETQGAQLEKSVRSEGAFFLLLRGASRAYREASNSAFFLGQYQKAIDHGEKALSLAIEMNDPLLKLTALSSLVQAYRGIRNHSKAEDSIELGLKIAQQFSPLSQQRTWWDAVFHAYRSTNFRRKGEDQKAIDEEKHALQLYEKYLERMSDAGRSGAERRELALTNMAFIYERLGRSYLALGNSDDALRQYRHGLEIAQDGNLQFARIGLFQGLGDVYAERKDYSAALDYFNRAIELARRQQRVSHIANTARRMGDLYRAMDNKSQAVIFYREAIDQIESIRSLLTSGPNRQSYFGGWLASYRGLIEMLWSEKAYAQAFHYGERVRARTFLDMLGHKVRLTRAGSPLAGDERAFAEANETGEGEQAYREFLEKARQEDPEQASLMSVQPLTLKEVQRLLGPGQVLLQYLVTPGKTYLWAVERTRLSAYTIAVSRNELKVKIDALRRAVSNIEALDDYQRIARDLYERLLGPAGRRLRGKEIIVVPHDVLHYVPFHALYSPQGKYLVESHAVSYLSSASLLQFVSSKRREKASKVLSVGNPQVDSDRENLLLAELEVAEIKKQFPASTLLLRDEASEIAIKRLSPQFDALHFAGHAELNNKEPLASAILLAEGSGEDGRLEVGEVFRMNLKASLVVLSGCETALGQLSTGDELVGLTRAFIYAGTPSVIASLWKVDDGSTAQLMSSFYRNLKTTTKVEALRQAQLALIRGEGGSDLLARRGVSGIGKLAASQSVSPTSQAKASPSASIPTSHPYFWAPFILVGDGK